MMQSFYANSNEQESSSAHPQLVGEGQHPDKMQGHWVLARAGKRVLRPGGLELTRQMLDGWQSAHRIAWLSSLQDSESRPAWFCGGVLRRIGE